MFQSAALQNLIYALLGQNLADALRNRLFKAAAGSLILKIFLTGMLAGTAILLARLLGVASYGAYAYAMTWVKVLIVPVILGLGRLLVRNVAVYETQQNWALLNGLLRWSNFVVAVLAIGIALLMTLIAPWLLKGEPEAIFTFQIAMLLLPILALTRLRQAVLRGLHRVVIGQLPEAVIQPVVYIVLIGFSYISLRDNFNAPTAVSLNIAASAVAFFVGVVLLRKYLPLAVKQASPGYAAGEWIRTTLPLLVVSSMRIATTRMDTLLLGALQGTAEVGIYAAALRAAELISFALLAANAALDPTIASLYAKRDMKRLQRVITRSARLVFLISLPVGLGFILFGHWFLWLFGPKFVVGQMALAILSVGQILNTSMGPAASLLVMTGHERDVAMSMAAGAILNVVFNLTLIPLWGINGAAMANVVGLMIWNLMLVVLVYKRLDIHSTALGRIKPLWKH